MSTDLIFLNSGAPNPHLVFGSATGVAPSDISVNLVASFPPLVIASDMHYGVHASFVATLPALTGTVAATYMVNAQRVIASKVTDTTQVAQKVQVGVADVVQHAQRVNVGTRATPTQALPIFASVAVLFTPATRTDLRFHTTFEDGAHYWVKLVGRMQEGSPAVRVHHHGHFQEGDKTQKWPLLGKFEDGLRTSRRSHTERFQESIRSGKRWHTVAGFAAPSSRAWHSRYQTAWAPPPGRYVRPVVVPPTTPIQYWDANLVFACPPLVAPNLIFGLTQCTLPTGPVGQVVVPIQRIYMVINDATLRRVDGNISLPTYAMSLSLDTDSWTWGFSATLPGSELANLDPATNGAPVEVEVMINGVPYRALVEGITRTRTFGKNDIQIQGRGKTALLDAPYAPTMAFSNTIDRTAQQLMSDVLSINGQPMGWGVTWGLTDWLVPAGVFSHSGSYIGAVNAIAAAAGGYVQPHASAESISILPRYPVAPWDWAGLTPDFDLPADVTTQESINWVEKPRYNRVYVSGVQQGVLGQVTRGGTAGDLLAPMVTDSLITTADAARQRGLQVLSNTGRIANVSLRLPVLAQTGVINPGKLVRYTDGPVTRLGLVRSVGVDISMPEIWQTIGIETHVN